METQPANQAHQSACKRAAWERTLTRTSGFKIQLKTMFIDTSLNSVATVFANLYQSFYESAVRCLEYARVLTQVRTTCSSLLISKSNLCPKQSLHCPKLEMYRAAIQSESLVGDCGQICRIESCAGRHYENKFC